MFPPLWAVCFHKVRVRSWKGSWKISVTAVQLLSHAHGLQLARLLLPPLSPGVCSNSCPLIWWCYLTILSSAASFSFYMRIYSFIHAYTYIITDFVCTFPPFLSFLIFLLNLSFKKSFFLRRYIMQLTFPEIFYWALENRYLIYIIWHSCNISDWKYFCNNIKLLF